MTLTGELKARAAEAINEKLPTGAVELYVADALLQSSADQLPLQVNSDDDAGEDIRLKYRYLDLRRERVHTNIMLRSQIISSLRAPHD